MFSKKHLLEAIEVLENLREHVRLDYSYDTISSTVNEFELPILNIFIGELPMKKINCDSNVKHNVVDYLKDKF